MMTLQELQKRYNIGERFEYNFFWGGYLSNWFESSFIVDNVYYWCTEQYMMAKKAELFGDFEIQEEIMKSLSQKEIKGLGRQIRNFNDDIWDKNKIKIVFEGNYAKYKSNPKLKSYLINQRNKILVEASPYDNIWGIGLSKNDLPLIENPNNWKGTNLLGFILMDVRDKIISESR